MLKAYEVRLPACTAQRGGIGWNQPGALRAGLRWKGVGAARQGGGTAGRGGGHGRASLTGVGVAPGACGRGRASQNISVMPPHPTPTPARRHWGAPVSSQCSMANVISTTVRSGRAAAASTSLQVSFVTRASCSGGKPGAAAGTVASASPAAASGWRSRRRPFPFSCWPAGGPAVAATFSRQFSGVSTASCSGGKAGSATYLGGNAAAATCCSCRRARCGCPCCNPKSFRSGCGDSARPPPWGNARTAPPDTSKARRMAHCRQLPAGAESAGRTTPRRLCRICVKRSGSRSRVPSGSASVAVKESLWQAGAHLLARGPMFPCGRSAS